MTNPYPSPSPYPAPPEPAQPPKASRFVGLAWAALILGIVGVVGSPIIIFNNLTAIAAGVGLVLGIIALFGTKKVLAGIGTALCVAGIAITVVVQQAAVEELDRALTEPAVENAGGPAPTLPDPAPADDAAADEGPETNERDYIPMKLGDEAWTGPPNDENGPSGTTFAIDKIEVDPPCHAYGMPPESGHTLVLHVRVATGTDRMTAMDAMGVINPFSFVEIGSNGVSHQAEMGICTDPAKALTTNFGVNQKYSGLIELVVPEASGTLALSPGGMLSGPAGWEWTY